MLVQNARNFWKMYSVWVFGIIGAGAMVQEQWGAVSSLIPDQWQAPVLTGLSVLGIVGRLLKQDAVNVE